ncbi:MAG: flippase-like domain-containing protein [Anaerolineales bacterium]|nr:flippase-like domain-containing protein [Anaerolineales bacterium]
MKRWQLWLGLAISAFFIWLSLRGLQLQEVWSALVGAKYLWLLPGILIYFVGVWARAWRWHYLLRPLKKISTRRMFPIVTIGYMGNNIYPARAGELLRAYILRQREGVPVSASLATILVERALDGVVMLAFVFLNLSEVARLNADSGFAGSIRALAFIGAAVFLGAVLVFLLMAVFPQKAIKLVGWFSSRLVPERFRAQVNNIAERFLDGLASLRSPLDVLMVLLTSIIIWLLETGKYWFVMHAFPFEVSFFALMLMNGIVNLATTIPSAPGYIGTFDGPGIAVLVAYGVGRATAAGYTLVLHAALWFPITMLGAYYMVKSNLSWQSVQEELATESDA